MHYYAGIVEIAYGINPNDHSEAAAKRRNVEIADFNNLRFIARVGIEKSKDPAYPDKNRLEAVTPDRKEWKPVEQLLEVAQMGLPGVPRATAAPAGTATAKPAQAITRPAWADSK